MTEFHAIEARAAAFESLSLTDGHSGQSGLHDLDVGRSSLPPEIAFPSLNFRELDFALDPNRQTLWCHMKPKERPSFTPGMLTELNALIGQIRRYMSRVGSTEQALRYFVMGSRIKSIYNLGGELVFLVRKIREGDRAAVRRYAHDCIDAVHAIYHGFDHPILSISMVQGDALGGGLEAALCFNTIVAERGVKMGLPEVLFGSFPGMGAYSLLSRRIGPLEAEKMIMSGTIYTAEQFYEMGIVDILAEPGNGAEAVSKYIEQSRRRHGLLTTMRDVKSRVHPLPKQELADITDMWVDNMMQLADSDLRRMERLTQAQDKRLSV